MKKYLFAILIIVAPSTCYAQSFETVDACKSLQKEVAAAVEESRSLTSLMTKEDMSEAEYLSQLYEGVKILSKSGEMFFKASDSHESTCKTVLREKGKIADVRTIYDWYLEPVHAAYQFFRRAREAAVRLNRQEDVNAFNATMTEYDASIMKLVGVCESDLAGLPEASTCANLSAKLSDALTK